MSEMIDLTPTPRELMSIGAAFTRDLLNHKVKRADRADAASVLSGLIEVVRVLVLTDARDGTSHLKNFLDFSNLPTGDKS